MPTAKTRAELARENYARYWYGRQRGHIDWCKRVKRFEDLYLGGGRQWLPQDKAFMEEEEGRKCFEINEIAEAVNTAIGFQVSNRVDIAFRARGGGATEGIAKTLSKVVMQIADNVKFPWVETDVFMDGLIQQRGYYETRLTFHDSIRGEIGLWALDPLDVIPDPDAKSYDPDRWQDVTITRWMTLDEIEGLYGTKARRETEEYIKTAQGDTDHGLDDAGAERNTFGGPEWASAHSYDAQFKDANIQRVRVIDRQHWITERAEVVIFPTGDIRLAENADDAKRAAWEAQGCFLTKRPTRRVRWTVSAGTDTLLYDDWSPYNHFTVVPYFPYFRRGKTKGGIDDLESPQELLNKAVSQYIHIVNSTANSGWMVEENSLTNMTTEDLENYGAKTGVTMEYRKGATEPKKIEPNKVPEGLSNLITLGSEKIRTVSGVNEAMRGLGAPNQSGVAVQSLQFAAQMSLAMPIDNLGKTRHLLAQRWLELIQDFMDDPRIWRIIKTESDGSKRSEELMTNWPQEDEDGVMQVMNDLTIGEYDAVITEQPSQVTFENSQFNQAMDMRERGIRVPDDVVLRYSNLYDKAEVIERMMEMEQSADPIAEARAAADNAKAAESEARAISKNVESLFSAIRTAQIIAQMPQVSPIADTIVKSAGFQDKDAAPIYGEANPEDAGDIEPPPDNTNPVTPDNPERGMNTGIEAGVPADAEAPAIV